MATPLASLEEDAAQFITAMRHANHNLLLLRKETNSTVTDPAPPTGDGASTNASTQAATADSPANPTPTATSTSPATPHPATNTPPTPAFPHHSSTTTTPPPDPDAPLAAPRAAFEAMRQQWLLWGASVARSLEAWLARPELGVVERVRVIGWLDRMAWYGVRGGSEG